MHIIASTSGFFALAFLTVAGCTGVDTPSEQAENDITDIPRTSPRDQRETGNCWLYATAAWTESLEYEANAKSGAASAPAHYAVAYWDYWDWYAKIARGQIHAKTAKGIKDELDSGGSWGSAVEFVLARGLVHDGDFLGDAASTDAKATTRALGTLADSLASGALASEHARRDRALVRREIERAFHVPTSVVAALTDVFGDGAATLAGGARAGGIVIDAGDVRVLHPSPSGEGAIGTLREAIGDRAPGEDPDLRTGPHAWSDVVYDAKTKQARRAFFRRIQKALHAGAAIPIGWFWASNADPTNTGEFASVPSTPAAKADSVDHETVIYDYEIDDVPGYGRLAVGAVATPAQQEAALAEEARVDFFRAKDSYYGYRKGKNARTGYTDLYVDYLAGTVRVCPAGAAPSSNKCNDQVPLEDVTLPPGF